MPTNPAAISQVGTPPSYPTRPGTTDKAQFLADTATADARFPVYNTELNTATTELNAAATVTYNNAVEAAASAVTASDAAATAQSASSYKGAWSSLTGALNLPASVSHSGKTWRLENNLADVTLSEPGVSGDWTDITNASPSGDNTFTGTNTFNQTPSEADYTLTGTVVDPANGGVQTKTMTTPQTLTETLSNGQSVVLRLIDADQFAVTFPAGTFVTAAGNVAPTLTADYFVIFVKTGGGLFIVDGGSAA